MPLSCLNQGEICFTLTITAYVSWEICCLRTIVFTKVADSSVFCCALVHLLLYANKKKLTPKPQAKIKTLFPCIPRALG